MKKYLSLVKKQIGLGFVVELVQIPREENEQADHLPKATSAKHMTISSQVLSFIQYSLWTWCASYRTKKHEKQSDATTRICPIKDRHMPLSLFKRHFCPYKWHEPLHRVINDWNIPRTPRPVNYLDEQRSREQLIGVFSSKKVLVDTLARRLDHLVFDSSR